MEWVVTPLGNLQRRREEMDLAWESFIKESALVQELKTWQWIEKLPKFEGTGRRSFKSRSNKAIRFWY